MDIHSATHKAITRAEVARVLAECDVPEFTIDTLVLVISIAETRAATEAIKRTIASLSHEVSI